MSNYSSTQLVEINSKIPTNPQKLGSILTAEPEQQKQLISFQFYPVRSNPINRITENVEISPDYSFPLARYLLVNLKKISDNLEFKYSLNIKLEKSDDFYIASCETLGLHISGESYRESLDLIKEVIADDYQSLLDDYPENLTQDAINLLRLYKALLGQDLP